MFSVSPFLYISLSVCRCRFLYVQVLHRVLWFPYVSFCLLYVSVNLSVDFLFVCRWPCLSVFFDYARSLCSLVLSYSYLYPSLLLLVLVDVRVFSVCFDVCVFSVCSVDFSVLLSVPLSWSVSVFWLVSISCKFSSADSGRYVAFPCFHRSPACSHTRLVHPCLCFVMAPLSAIFCVCFLLWFCVSSSQCLSPSLSVSRCCLSRSVWLMLKSQPSPVCICLCVVFLLCAASDLSFFCRFLITVFM